MKATHAKILLAVFLFSPLPLLFPGSGGEAPSPPSATEELVALERFLGSSDEELDQLIAALKRIRAMSPEERAEFGEQIREFRSLPGEQRRLMREGWRQRTRPDNEQWREHMRSLPQNERTIIQQKLDSLTPGERQLFREQILKEAGENR